MGASGRWRELCQFRNPRGAIHFFSEPLAVIAADPGARVLNDFGMGIAACGRVVEGIIPLIEQTRERRCKRCTQKVSRQD